MRKGFDGLSLLAQEVAEAEPVLGLIFRLPGQAGRPVKILYWDGQGFCLFANYLRSYCVSFSLIRKP